MFEKTIPEGDEPASPDLSRSQSLPDRFDELPIEILSLTDRFVESLSARTWSEPPNVDQLSDIFQEFYIKAASHVSTHISTLLRQLNKAGTPAPSRKPTKTSSDGPDPNGEVQQMLTAEEVAAKKKARKLLEYKRLLLEEAVEKRACEKVYDKIWRHKSTLDEVRDEKLRSKTGALALVGIGLRDLGIELDKKNEKTEEDIQESLSPAREGLAKMNDEKSPLGKLQHLTQAHKSIVETLSTIHPSSNSADEILPTLIYALITSPIEGINVISNLYYIQRFRTASKIDGEAAYCLTNLEAAISFLENVDLASLRADEAPEGPKPSSRPPTPSGEKAEPFPGMASSGPSVTTQRPTVATSSSGTSATISLHAPGPSVVSTLPAVRHQRTLSNLLKPSAQVLTSGSDAIRNSAEEGFKNISSTLDNSFKFLFGKLKERSEADDIVSPTIVPKTLDEARALVSRPMDPDPDDENIAASDTSSLAEKDTNNPLADTPPHAKPEDRLLSVLGGRKAPSVRERSVDSLRSNGSVGSAAAKRVARVANTAEQQRLLASNNPLDSVKNLGNPLSALGGAFGSIGRGFGGIARGANASPPAGPAQKEKALAVPAVAPEGLQAVMHVQPPVTRFMEMENVGELRVGDLEQLLREYQRVAGILKELCDGAKR